ncbi:MAG: hypothetical protein ACRECH_04355 [Nitrososphaerales archaeon]
MAEVIPASFTSLNETLKKLVELRKSRDERDYWVYSESLLLAAKTLRTEFGAWIDSEKTNSFAQINLLLPFSEGQAREKLQGLKTELEEINRIKIPDAKSKVHEFIQRMEAKSLTKTSEVIQAVTMYLGPSLSIISRLNEIRNEIDTMTDMTLAIGSSMEISPEESRDVESSIQEIREGKTRTVRDVATLIRELESD